MPLYDYKCQQHGVFSELTTIANMESPVDCPQCGVVSPRILALPPHIVSMMKETKQAMERNEKAQHEPIISTLERRTNDKKHASDCGCSSGKKSNLFYTAEGNKMFPSMRPWMISHQLYRYWLAKNISCPNHQGQLITFKLNLRNFKPPTFPYPQ